MKLSPVDYTRKVESRGRKDGSILNKAAKKKATQASKLGEMNISMVESRNTAVQGVLDKIGSEATKMHESAIKDEVNAELAKSQFALAKHLQSVDQKEYYSPNELPPGVMDASLAQYGDMIPKSKVQAGLLKEYQAAESDGRKKTMSAPAYEKWEKAMESNYSKAELGTQQEIFEGELKQRKQEQLGVVRTYVEQLDPVSAVKFINESTILTEAEKAVQIKAARQAVSKNRIYQAIDSGDPMRMHNELQHLSDPGYNGVLTPAAKVNLRANLRIEIGKATKVNQAQLSRRRAKAGADLEIAINRGQRGYEDVSDAYNDGIISEAKFVQLTSKVDKFNQAVNTTATQVNYAASAINEGQPLSRTSRKDRESLDALFASAPSLEAAEFIAVKTGYIPKQAEETLDAVVAAGTGAQLSEAVGFYTAVNSRNPNALQDLSSETRAGLVAMAELSTLSPSEALEHLNTKRKMLPSQAEEVSRQYRAETKDDPNVKALSKLMSDTDTFNDNNWFGLNVEVEDAPSRFTGEYEALVKSFYNSTGDIKIAQKAAFDKLETRWRVSTVNGKEQIMRDAPEALYPGIPGDLFRRDIKRQFGKNKGLVMLPDALTNKSKAYMVYEMVDDLPSRKLDDKGQPLWWLPAPGKQIQIEQKERNDRMDSWTAEGSEGRLDLDRKRETIKGDRERSEATANQIMKRPEAGKGASNVTLTTKPNSDLPSF